MGDILTLLILIMWLFPDIWLMFLDPLFYVFLPARQALSEKLSSLKENDLLQRGPNYLLREKTPIQIFVF